MGNASQDVVHEPLEGLASILQPKRHPQELPQAKGSDDGRLLHISGLHWNLPVPLPEVNGGEEWGMPAKMLSTNLWKVWPAFSSPKGILRNSHRPKGVMTAVFSTSLASTGICQYPFLRSMVVKNGECQPRCCPRTSGRSGQHSPAQKASSGTPTGQRE